MREEQLILIKLPGEGLVPISYHYLSNDIYYGFTFITSDEANEKLHTFDEFLSFIRNDNELKLYLMYIEQGFPIPVNPEELKKIKEKMTTPKEYKKILEEESILQDLIINREI